MQKSPVCFLGQEGPLEKGKATHSCILAWRIPWTVHGVAKTLSYSQPPTQADLAPWVCSDSKKIRARPSESLELFYLALGIIQFLFPTL